MRALLVVSCLAALTCGASSCTRGEPGAATTPAAETTPAPSATCPSDISVAQSLSAPATGWDSFEDDTPTQLMSVGVFDGHPREQASLVPDSDTESAGRRVVVWQLAEKPARGYWLACYYDHSRIALTRMLPAGITRVEVTRDPQSTVAGQPVVTDIAFK
jgi:hypothetical protein